MVAARKYNESAINSHETEQVVTWPSYVVVSDDLTEDEKTALVRNPYEPKANPDSCFEVLKQTLWKNRPLEIGELGLSMSLENLTDPANHLSMLNA